MNTKLFILGILFIVLSLLTPSEAVICLKDQKEASTANSTPASSSTSASLVTTP